MWKEHFKNLLPNSRKLTDKPITKIMCNQLDIKLIQFTEDLNVVLMNIKSRKAAGFDKISQEAWTTKEI